MDPRWFREVLGQYPTGVSVVTAETPEGEPVGFVVGSFTSVSLDPPLVAFCPVRSSRSWAEIRRARSFCVNVLGADQEDVCRRFATPVDDRFAGVACRRAGSGSPIIESAVAWIDCDIEAVHEAGDHDIVVGRVRDLDVAEPSLPLLFYKGGYGRFSPLSLAAGNAAGALTDQLREVDLVRGELERLAGDLPGARCTTVALVEEQLVVTAGAGGFDLPASATLVGQRFPFVPPLGSVFAAWADAGRVNSWLHGLRDGDRAAWRERLEAVRQRGFSVALLTEEQRSLQSALADLASDPDAVDRERLDGHLRRLHAEPIQLTPEVRADVGVVNVPVFGRRNEVALMLTVYGFAQPSGLEGVDAVIDRVVSAARCATERLQAPATSAA